jgi:hypothetical protein
VISAEPAWKTSPDKLAAVGRVLDVLLDYLDALETDPAERAEEFASWVEVALVLWRRS